MNQSKAIYFHASSVGTLLVGGSPLWTGNDTTTMEELNAREAGTFKTAANRKGDYTDKMKASHAALREKRKRYDEILGAGGTAFELGQTAKSYVEDVWRLLNMGFRRPVITKEILKGIKMEQDAIDLISQVYPVDGFRMINKQNFKDDYFIGRPDVLIDKFDFLEDVKVVWDKQIFMKIDSWDPLYEAQAQVYMHLTNRQRFFLHYCLLTTPPELVKREQRNHYWTLVSDGEDDNDDYRKVCEQIEKNHNCEDLEPAECVKSFAFTYDPEYIANLQFRIDVAREYYSQIKFNAIPRVSI